jgi:ribose transport system substrate-binding protein
VRAHRAAVLRCVGVALLAAVAAGFGAACRRQETTITLVPKAMDSEFWLELAEGARTAVAARPDVRLLVAAPEREINIEQQVSILEDQVRRGVQALVVAPASSERVRAALDEAADRGIPVVFVDSDAPFPRKVTYVGTDNRLGGALAARVLAEAVGGRGDVALIHGVPGNTSQDERASGFVDALSRHAGLKLVARQPANSERALGLTVMEGLLASHPSLAGVFATNDQMALGAVEAVEERGLRGRVRIVGFDATEEAVRATMGGRMAGTIAQNPHLMGRKSVEAALAALEGRPVEKRVDTGTEAVTLVNAARYLR